MASRDVNAPRPDSYQVERLDDVSNRLSHIEGELKGMATKADVANAKYSMLLAWLGLGMAVVVGAASIIIRFLSF